MSPKVHLVIPCFHESGRLESFLRELADKTREVGDVTILIVDDGSGEEEQGKMQALVEAVRVGHPQVRPALMLPQNLGKGGAVHAGWQQHQGEEWLGFVDADGACSADETMRLMALALNTRDEERALFASRVRLLGRRVERHWHRDVIGRMYALLVSAALGIPVHDSQCGLKLVPRRAYERVAPVLRVDDFGFDIELLAALVDSGCPVQEVPVDWHEVRGGKLRLFRDAWKMFRDILEVRRRRGTEEWRAVTGLPGGHKSGGLAE